MQSLKTSSSNNMTSNDRDEKPESPQAVEGSNIQSQERSESQAMTETDSLLLAQAEFPIASIDDLDLSPELLAEIDAILMQGPGSALNAAPTAVPTLAIDPALSAPFTSAFAPAPTITNTTSAATTSTAAPAPLPARGRGRGRGHSRTGAASQPSTFTTAFAPARPLNSATLPAATPPLSHTFAPTFAPGIAPTFASTLAPNYAPFFTPTPQLPSPQPIFDPPDVPPGPRVQLLRETQWTLGVPPWSELMCLVPVREPSNNRVIVIHEARDLKSFLDSRIRKRIAMHAQAVGVRVNPECKQCAEGKGQFVGCVVIPGLLEGACANCVWEKSRGQYGQCTFCEFVPSV